MNKAHSCKYFKGVPVHAVWREKKELVEIGWSIQICESMLARFFIIHDVIIFPQ